MVEPKKPSNLIARSGIKDDTQEEIQVETKTEDKAVENFEDVDTLTWKKRG